MNYYDILEVSSKASPAVIKAAYKSLMQRYHPDKNNNDSDSGQRAAQLVQAYEVLSDEVRRAGYDQQMQTQAALRRGPSPAAASGLNRTPRYARTKPQDDAHGYRVVWVLIIATIVLAVWFLLPLSKPSNYEQSPLLPADRKALPTEAPGKDTPASAPLVNNRLVMLELAVSLVDTDKLTVNSVRILKIPILSLGISDPEAKKLLWYLDDRKVQLRQMVEAKLAFAVSGQLLSDTGPKYVRELVWQTVLDMASAQSPELASQAYNIEIDLPKAFSASLFEKNQLQLMPGK